MDNYFNGWHTHILCLHSGPKGWVTVWREFLATVRCSIEALRTQNLCVGGVGKRQKRDRRQRKSIRDRKACHSTEKASQVYTHKGSGAQSGREREVDKVSESVRIRLEGG